MIRATRRSYVADIALLVALTVLFFWRSLIPAGPDRWSFDSGDFTEQFFASARYEAGRLAAGEIPLWNPYAYGGHPFQADVQSAVFYPPSLITLGAARIVGFSQPLLEFEAITHFALAAVFTYLLGRRLTGSRFGGLIAGTIFAFGGYLTSYPARQLAILETVIWLPLVLLLLEAGSARWHDGRRRQSVVWVLGAGLALGVAYLAGHPQSAMLVTYGAGAFALLRFWPRSSPRAWSGWLRTLAIVALAPLVGLALAAVQIVPSWEFTRLSTRAALGFDVAGGGFQPYDLLQLVLPQVAGDMPALYLGIATLGLLGVGLARAGNGARCGLDRSDARFFGWTGLVALILSFGKLTPLYTLFYHFAPGWGLFRDQERTILLTVLAVALLAGSGAAILSCVWSEARERVRAGEKPGAPAGERPLILGYVAGTAGAVVLAAAFFVQMQAGKEALWGFASAALFLALLFLLGALAWRVHSPALLLGLLVVDLFTLSQGHLAGAPKPEIEANARQLLSPAQADTGAFRVADEFVLPGNFGLTFDLQSTQGISPLQLQRYADLVANVPLGRAWQLLNVKYVASWRGAVEVPTEVAAQGTGRTGEPATLFRILDPGPRTWLVARTEYETQPARIWQRLSDPQFDPMATAVIEQPVTGFDGGACGGTVHPDSWAPEHIALTTSTSQPCLLMLSEIHYPGWRGQVDGQAVEVLRADGVLRAMPVPTGEHLVTLDFRPVSFYAGAGVSLATLLAVIGSILALRAREPR